MATECCCCCCCCVCFVVCGVCVVCVCVVCVVWSSVASWVGCLLACLVVGEECGGVVGVVGVVRTLC